MKEFKKVCIFLVILIIIVAITAVLPMKKTVDIMNTVSNANMASESNLGYTSLRKLYTSDISDEYKKDVGNLYKSCIDNLKLQNALFYKLLLYLALITPIVIGIVGIVCVKKSKDKKYIGSAFITSSIVSIVLIGLFAFRIYLSMNLNV